MAGIIATALRVDRTIQFTVHGYLPNNSWGMRVLGIHPGDTAHIDDPGCAQVFLGKYQVPGPLASLHVPIPWGVTVNILDAKHDKVALFINGREVKRVEVTVRPPLFEVFAYSGSSPHWGTIIMPSGHTMGRLFHRVFGPASHEDCTRWVEQHAKIEFY